MMSYMNVYMNAVYVDRDVRNGRGEQLVQAWKLAIAMVQAVT